MGNRTKLIVAGVGVAVFGWWATSPPTEIAFDDSCNPKGVQARISERLNTRTFWNNQLTAAEREVQNLQEEPAKQAQINKSTQDVQRIADAALEKFYMQHPELRPSAATQESQKLRDMADAIDAAQLDQQMEKYRLKRIAMLQRCEREIERFAPRN